MVNLRQQVHVGLKALLVWMARFAVAMGLMAVNNPPQFLVGVFMFGANLLAPVGYAKGGHKGAVIGAVIGGLLGLAVLAGFFYLLINSAAFSV